jgi:pimeloyl-ACP methyl ester carboxylesterase
MLDERTFDTGEVTINYAEGAQVGPPAVVLHGVNNRWQGVQGLITMLEPHWHVYALDLRGHGLSGHVPGQYHLTDFARDVGAFVTSLPEPAVVVGFSLGALVAIATVAEGPDSVRAAVLVDPPIYAGALPTSGRTAEHKPIFYQQMRWLAATLQTSRSADAVLARILEFAPQADRQWASDTADQVSYIDPDVPASVVEDRMFADYELAGALRRMRCPLLLLYGEWDRGGHLRDEDAAFVRTHVPQAVVAKVPGSHGFFTEHPELVRQHLDAFLESV